MSFKPEVSTDGGQTFHRNGLAFATKEEAELSAKDVYNRWMLATHWRAVESEDPVNYQIVDGVMSAVEPAVAA